MSGKVSKIVLAAIIVLYAKVSFAGPYMNSAHGSETYGVDRTSTSQYTQGHCGHCHEQHSSIAGVEPAPAPPLGTVPDDYLLFRTNFTSQTDNFCYDCHVVSGGYQAGGITINRSYSYNFGGDTSAGTYDADIAEAFSHTATAGSSHYLPSIQSQILGQTLQDADGNTWSLPADLNPCDACHNPHIVQRNYPVSEVGGLLATAVTRPSDPDNLWGDAATERMDQLVGYYQQPYWFGSETTYEPNNAATSDAAKTPDYTRLCSDCHNSYNTIYSENPRLPRGPRNILQIDWGPVDTTVTADAHGDFPGAPDTLQQPFADARIAQGNLVLSCLDCHEPHGSATNIYLIRASVNGGAVSLTDETDAQWLSFCQNTCHSPTHDNRNGCASCHYHGADRGGF
jgi:hypothetical protein